MEGFLLLGLLLAAGYVLGIVGFFRANTAHTEIQALRRTIAGLTRGETQVTPEPAAAIEVPRPIQSAAATPIVEPPPIPSQVTTPITEPPIPAAVPAATPAAPSHDLETLLTARWGIWLGSAALLLAGVFLIRYAVEQELLGPPARCALAALLGVALLAAAEWLTRHEPPAIAGPIPTDQAPAGLAAGGAAVLFGAAYGAGPFYALLPPLLAFAALALASFIGLLAALRYGQLTAAVGIAGAFATPALVSTENPELTGLFAYLTVVTAASLAVVRYTAWTWLGWAATFAGAVWICLAAAGGGPDLWAAGAFVPIAAALNIFLLPAAALDHPIGRRLAWVPFAVIGLAGLVLQSQDPEYGSIVGLMLLSPVAVWRGRAEPRLDRLPWLAALFGLLTLLLWNLPVWVATGEAITVDGMVQAFFPGDWAPEAIRPLIFTAAGFGAFHAAAGLWQERRAPDPLRWSALTAAVPVLTLLIAYAQIARFQTDFRWAIVALAIAAGLTVAAALARNEAAAQRAGVHAAGAVAALALGCAMLLHDHWLTMAVSLFLPALALIEARADLPPLRHVALAVAIVVMVRLVLNWYILDYAFGSTPIANGLIAAYAVPAAAFALASVMFRRRADDVAVAVLEGGAVAFATIFVALEIRHAFGEGQLQAPGHFSEGAVHLLTLSVQATTWLWLARRTGRRALDIAARVLGGIALIGGGLAILFNPAFTDAQANVATLAFAYLFPGALALAARGLIDESEVRRLLGGYALITGFVWISLQIRYLFHPQRMDVIFGSIDDAELWCWSGAWLVYGIALMVAGIRMGDRLLRFAALAVVGLVCLKVFLIDMSDLTGLWRVLSFLGLGLALIGLGVVHRRLVLPARQAEGV
jgi:uncharacterized membrane protein